ncbi:threonine synthase [Cystobasidium minutum MCA 4210]|uniref:threonine synthase n=1 Tax=Cystobasidium minutum MCA 4210 TaxID=1397322 RepID=UPI0034CFBB98|eukprot:jgi/Rhomi1/166171/fgenesh1_kg.1_\
MTAIPKPMKYLSTRGGEERLSFEETVMTGLAQDGGLFIPASMPRLPANWQTEWKDLSFQELALQVYSLFIDESEIPRSDLAELINKSYSTFRKDEVAPLKQINDNEYILELFHGPTFAFKDVALQFLGNLFEYFLKRRNANKDENASDRERLTVVGATSGDTGSAAIYGLRGKKDVSIFITFPKGKVSPIQEAQMTTVEDENVFNLAVEGTFDDCQDIVKALFADTEFNTAYRLGAVNSINWARILAQIVYYFSSYFSLLKQLNAKSPDTTSVPNLRIQYAVPTGNFGDILAGFYAKRLGLPVEPLLIATNENDILTRFFRTGRYEKADSSVATSTSNDINNKETLQTEKVHGTGDGSQSSSGVKATLSPAMDILVSSNFERLLWYLAFEHMTSGAAIDENRGDVDGGIRVRIEMAGKIVKEWMAKLKSEGSFAVPTHVLKAAQREFVAERVSDQETIDTIRRYHRSDSPYGAYIADPHTAVGLCAASHYLSTHKEEANGTASSHSGLIQIILSTAHPAKFSSAVEEALSENATFDFNRDVLPDEFKGLLEKERRVIEVKGTDPELTKKVVKEQVKKLFGNIVGKDGKSQAENTTSV